MIKLSREEIELLAKLMMVHLSDEEAEALFEDQSLIQLSEFVEKVDTEDVEMMELPFEEYTDYLREDVADHTLDREKALLNAPESDGEFIELVQVVDKND